MAEEVICWAVAQCGRGSNRNARAFHWPLEFPDVMQREGVRRARNHGKFFSFLEQEYFLLEGLRLLLAG